MKDTLYVTDLDGTLMRDDKTISAEAVHIINDCIEKGMLFTCATARSVSSASRITANIHFRLPIIVRNGTMLADTHSNKMESVLFTSKELASIRQSIGRDNIPGFVTSYLNGEEEKLYVKGISNVGFDAYLANHENDKRLRAVRTEAELYEGAVCYFTYIGERDALEPLYQRIKDCKECAHVFQKDNYREEYWLEIFPKDATKAKAIQRLQRRYHCERLVVFGDSLNDISMFQIADEAYAVENADVSLKAISTGIIGDNNSDSVAKWLQTHAV